jgi:hypothetical protein
MTYGCLWLTAPVVLLVGTAPLLGQANPFDRVTPDRPAPGVVCYHHAQYIVVERRVMEVGSDLFVRPAQSRRCDADSLPGDYVWRNQDADYFLGVRGELLFIDRGTGPDARTFLVVNLRTRRQLVQMDYVGSVIAGPDSLTVGIWQGYTLTKPAAGCPATEMIPGVDSLFWLDVRSGVARFAKQTRCAERQ